MVVREDGTKWACQSCLKGHRVSGCTHTDRELTLVPKKGRPVTQCQHCRLERKKRSAHHKCDCGETEKPHHPKEKCIHLREAEERIKAGFHDDHSHPEKDSAHLVAVAEEQGCCCPHGGKCTCSTHRKDSNPSSDGVAPHGPAVHKPRLESARSDGSITVFANGHHKPVHRKNHAAHECGMPYKMPMTRAHTDQNITTARRSVDNLALDSNANFNQSSFILPGQYPGQRRQSKSEQHSPKLSAMAPYSTPADNRLSLDFTTLGPVKTNRSIDSAASDTVMFPPFDPMSGVAESSYDPWSAFPGGDSGMFPNNNPFGAWATNFDGGSIGQPALTAASSGTQSEIDEIPPMDEVYGFSMPSIQEDTDNFNVDSTMGDGGNPNRRSLPPNFFGNTDFSLPIMDNEWQTPVAGLRGPEDTKMKSAGSDQGFEDAWQTPTMQTVAGLAPRATAMAPITGRPQSHSIGPGNVPSDDVIKQLFPDIDIGGGLFGAANSPQVTGSPALKRMAGLPTSNPASVPMEFSVPEETVSYNTRPWDDGSISVPADAFSSPYNLDQDFTSEWAAQ